MKIMFTNSRYEIHNRPKMETTKIHLQESMNFVSVTLQDYGWELLKTSKQAENQKWDQDSYITKSHASP